jgi:molecular chaperone DnaK
LPQVEVKFDIDASGILTVTALDKATNKTQSIKVEGSIGLSKEDIEKMKKEAEIHAAEDQKKRDAVETKNIADNLIYTCEKTLKDNADKIQENDKQDVEAKITELKKVKESDNIDDIKKKTEELSQAIQKIGAQMYQQQQQPQEKKEGEANETPEAETEKE